MICVPYPRSHSTFTYKTTLYEHTKKNIKKKQEKNVQRSKNKCEMDK